MDDNFNPFFMFAGIAATVSPALWLHSKDESHVDIVFLTPDHRLGDMVDALFSVRSSKTLLIDKVRTTLICEAHPEDPENTDITPRRIFEKRRLLNVDNTQQKAKRFSFSCGLALPIAEPDRFNEGMGLADMAALMRAQLQGVAELPSEMSLADGLETVQWRFEVECLHKGRRILVHSQNVPVIGFAGVSARNLDNQNGQAA